MGRAPRTGKKNFVDSHFVGEKQCFGLVTVKTRKRTGSFTAKNCVKLLSAKFTGALGPENQVTAQNNGEKRVSARFEIPPPGELFKCPVCRWSFSSCCSVGDSGKRAPSEDGSSAGDRETNSPLQA